MVKNELNVNDARFFISRTHPFFAPFNAFAVAIASAVKGKHDEIFTAFLSHYKFQTSTKCV